ncbi:lysophosphatidylcholine acyltransferase 2B isoform X2 [Mus pahari]|uniref:lysophosphatidylcholine acyltransferase 2B isoform X2 n=1 Tax=Mus pahari TaxID=10093 RepID=UPI0011148912|nr:lysophosphatidylcholine acyltransferase 2B isoform X2 [Mus pahari]
MAHQTQHRDTIDSTEVEVWDSRTAQEVNKSLYPPAVDSPFTLNTHLSAWRWACTIILGTVLVPMRVSCIVFLLILLWPVAVLSTINLPTQPTKPIRRWRKHLIKLALIFLFRLGFFFAGFLVKVKGKRATREEAPIFVAAPHSTFFDAIAVVVAGLPSVVSDNQLVRVPLVGKCILVTQPVLVKREDPNSRKTTRNEILTRVKPKMKWPQDTVTWTWNGFSGFQVCMLTLSQPFTRVEVEFMPVYIPSEEEKKDPILFANTVRIKMANALKLPVTDHSLEDCKLMISAGTLQLPMEAGLVEFTKISQKLKLDWDNIHKLLDKYASFAVSSKGGKIGIEEFSRYLKLPISEPLRQLFSLFDRNQDGTIDFREYVIGLTVLCNPSNTEKILQMSFKLFDLDADGCVTERELTTMLQAAFGVPDLDVSTLFQQMAGKDSDQVSYKTFRRFALKHPAYAKLFHSYLDLQAAYIYSLPGEV